MIPLNNVTTEKCQEYINELTSCNKKYSLATITKTYNLINSCFKYAVGVGDMQRNPMEYVKLPSADKVQTQTKNITVFTFGKSEKIYNECLKTYKNGAPVYRYGDLIILMLYLLWRTINGNHTPSTPPQELFMTLLTRAQALQAALLKLRYLRAMLSRLQTFLLPR